MSLDLHPAKVTVGDQTYTRARVHVDGDQAVVLIEELGAVSVVAGGHVEGLSGTGTSRQPARFTVGDTEVSAVKASGCGCGSVLARVDPLSYLAEARA